MRRTTVFTASLATALLCHSATLIAQSPRPEAVELAGQIPRVRSENPDIAEQIADATHQSSFFRALVAEMWAALRKAGCIDERDVTQLFDPQAGIFLADRFVVGGCPRCRGIPCRCGESTRFQTLPEAGPA